MDYFMGLPFGAKNEGPMWIQIFCPSLDSFSCSDHSHPFTQSARERAKLHDNGKGAFLQEPDIIFFEFIAKLGC
jgi:hypothetical protein